MAVLNAYTDRNTVTQSITKHTWEGEVGGGRKEKDLVYLGNYVNFSPIYSGTEGLFDVATHFSLKP